MSRSPHAQSKQPGLDLSPVFLQTRWCPLPVHIGAARAWAARRLDHPAAGRAQAGGPRSAGELIADQHATMGLQVLQGTSVQAALRQ
jgi:hypothetical protein